MWFPRYFPAPVFVTVDFTRVCPPSHSLHIPITTTTRARTHRRPPCDIRLIASKLTSLPARDFISNQFLYCDCYAFTWLSLKYRIICIPARLTGSRHGMPRSLHTEPCSPGIRGQQERLFPTTGKYKHLASIIGQRVTSHRMLSNTLC